MDRGIRDKVAIVGMSCTRFGERWDKSVDDLMIDAATECIADVPAATKDIIDAYWVGSQTSVMSGVPFGRAFKVDNKPVTRVENYCASGSEAIRNACFAVAAGAYDCVMAVGVEKMKDGGYSGIAVADPPHDGTGLQMSAPAHYAMLPGAYARKYSVSEDEIRGVLSHIAWKNHSNGADNPRAQYRRAVSVEQIESAPKVAGPLGVFDCSGVADGAAAALMVRAEDAHKYTDSPLYLKGLGLSVGSGNGDFVAGADATIFPEAVDSAARAYLQAGVVNPREDIALAEVHDCFTPTEMILMEDLGFSERGTAWKDILSGTFDRDGELPVNPDGGLKAFGHPVGATGLRMIFELWLQLRKQAGDRQLDVDGLGLAHNMGGLPGSFVSFVAIVGPDLG